MAKRMSRRDFFEVTMTSVGGLVAVSLFGCGKDNEPVGPKPMLRGVDAVVDPRKEVTLYDTHAMALYMDGGLGPKTGIIKVDYIIKNEKVDMKFWHGHGGKDHRFTLLPEHFADLKKLKKVTIVTTPVDGHTHKLFIDPVSAKYRVAGAQPVVVTIEG